MDETQPFDAILETYKKQETLLEEKREQSNKYLSEYQEASKCLENIIKNFDDQSTKFNKEELILIENTQRVSGICAESGLTWEEVKLKQNTILGSRSKMNIVSENQKDIIQEVSKDLRQLDVERQWENISKEIEDYRNKTKNVSQIVDERSNEYQNTNIVKTFGRQIPVNVKEEYKRKELTKSLIQTEKEIKKAKKNIHAINLKAEELKQQL